MYTKYYPSTCYDIDFHIMYFVDSKTVRVIDSFSIMNCPYDLAIRISKWISKVPNYDCSISIIR